jgi:hypothetical protein
LGRLSLAAAVPGWTGFQRQSGSKTPAKGRIRPRNNHKKAQKGEINEKADSGRIHRIADFAPEEIPIANATRQTVYRVRPTGHSRVPLSEALGQSARTPTNQARAQTALLQYFELPTGECDLSQRLCAKLLFFRRPHAESHHRAVAFGFERAMALSSPSMKPS